MNFGKNLLLRSAAALPPLRRGVRRKRVKYPPHQGERRKSVHTEVVLWNLKVYSSMPLKEQLMVLIELQMSTVDHTRSINGKSYCDSKAGDSHS